MTVENMETNGSQTQEAEHQSTENQKPEALALSVKSTTLLPQNRPVEPSHLEIVKTYSSVGSNRPVTKGTVNFNSSLAISGNRPIAVSTLKISDTYVMGNRPVAPNEMDDISTLMGYLD
ncbi:MAG: hypothetical protein Tsb0014_27940 [Pleurocapsa sp.]